MNYVLLKHPTRKKRNLYVEIDTGLVPMIKELWAAKVRTYECCEGHRGNGYWVNPFLIIHFRDFGKAKPILAKYIKRYGTEHGTGGYCPREYNPCAPGSHQDYLFIYWKMKA